MTGSQPRTPMAGGCLLSLAILAGVVIGFVQGQASLGFVIGLGIGVALAIAVWLRDRTRTR